MRKMRRWIVVGLQVLLALALLGSAVPKLAGAQEAMREHLAVAPWFWTVTALVELAGAAGMLVGLRFPRIATFAGVWIAALMVGALAAHVRAGDSVSNMIPAAVFLALALVVAWARRAGGAAPEERSDATRARPRAQRGSL